MNMLDYWPIALCALETLVYFIIGLFLVFLNEFPRNELEQERIDVDEYSVKVTERSTVHRRETWEAWGGAVNPRWLLGLRVVAFLYLSGLLLLVYTSGDGWFQVYKYYTEWTLTLLIVYFGFATAVSLFEEAHVVDEHRRDDLDAERGDSRASLLDGEHGDSTAGHSVKPLLDPYTRTDTQETKAGYLGYTLQILFQMVAPAVILTDVVYWTFLYPFFPDDFPHTFSELNVHAVNGIFLIAELFLNSMRFPWFRAGYFFIWSCCYVFFQWSVHALGPDDASFPYPFMEISIPSARLWYLVVGFINISAYALVSFLNRLKLLLQDRNSQLSSRARLWSLLRSFCPGGVP